MIVCICANISDKKIMNVLLENDNIACIKDLRMHLPVCGQCGKCKKDVEVIVEKHLSTEKLI